MTLAVTQFQGQGQFAALESTRYERKPQWRAWEKGRSIISFLSISVPLDWLEYSFTRKVFIKI